ncbi:MAG: L-serine ammonia-lyase, iron-sulfur-dependent, subunit alpha, partial [Trueperaceae bacterium]|nr:L-serine ammonia-lyase, iron-sulfur-dependent, subunit alpha [Trueperaceae bacterium]
MNLTKLAAYHGRASDAILADEAPTARGRAALLDGLKGRLREMRDSIERGLATDAPSRTGMVGWNAKTLWTAEDVLHAPLLKRVQAYAMAVNEENARMGRIVAAPTAGSAGTVPGALIGVGDHLGLDDDALAAPLALAAGIGQVIGKSMFIAGSTG